MKIIKLNSYTLSRLKGKLSNRKNVLILLKEKIRGITYNLQIELWRGDLMKPSIMNQKYSEETYILTIEKYDSRYASPNVKCIIDKRLEFSSLTDVIDYLDKNKFVKKSDWIIDEKKAV